jgi:hypothetical protein
MTFAQFLIALRRRAATLPRDSKRPEDIDRLAREIINEIPNGEQSAQVKRILAEFLGLGGGEKFDNSLLDQLTPEIVLQLDMIVAELVEFGRTRKVLRTRRGALTRLVQ